MSSRLLRKTGYQDPCNKLGYVTATQIGHPDRNSPARSVPLVRTTIYDEKPLEYVMKNPLPSDPVRNVYVPVGRDYVYEFNNDEPSAIRTAHPYLSQSQFTHRRFRPEELTEHASMNRLFHEKHKDVAIKLRILPVEGPFEQKLSSTNTLPNYDVRKEAPSPNDYSNQKYYFRRPLYRGCPPRVFKPVPRLGWAPLTQESYGWPFHCFNKENHTSAFAMCMYQPKETMADVRKVPWMYSTESQTYGGRRPVSTFINIHGPTTREIASNTIGEDCHFDK